MSADPGPTSTPADEPDRPGGSAGSRAARPAPDGQRASRPIDPMALISYLLSGILVYGGIGWLVDRWLGYTSLFLPIGVVLGVIGGGYLCYVRYLRS